jgi:hypothetical protein
MQPKRVSNTIFIHNTKVRNNQTSGITKFQSNPGNYTPPHTHTHPEGTT